jgi:Mrp family chromosome partitioning ATPase
MAQAVPGITVVARSMNDEERLGLRNFLRGAMAADAGPGHQPARRRTSFPRFLDKISKTRVLGISSGKGGVGKSSVTVNLAIALARAGYDVGVLDADVYGFSLPKMLGGSVDPIVLGDTVIPTLIHGVRSLSMGYFVPDEQPVIWRGPMLHKAIEQLVTKAWWDEPDFLLIDMPPGTGDVALTLSEVVPRIEMYAVTTPQAAAQRVAQRSGLRGAQAQVGRPRRDREHVVVHRRRWHPLRDLRPWRRRVLGQRPRGTAAWPDSPRSPTPRRWRRRNAYHRERSRWRSLACFRRGGVAHRCRAPRGSTVRNSNWCEICQDVSTTFVGVS